MSICPEKNSKEWKSLMSRVGSENIAYHIWDKTGGDLTTEKIDKVIKDMTMKKPAELSPVAKGIRQGTVNNTLDLLVGKMRKSMPNIDIRFVTDKDAFKNEPGYVLNGKIYLNTDRIRPDTPFHELGHIYGPILKHFFPELWGEFFNKATEMVKGGEIAQQVAVKQPYLNQHDQMEETIMTTIGFNSVDKVKDYFLTHNIGNDQQAVSFWNNTKELIRDAWDKIKAYVGNIFGMQPEYMKNIDLQNMTIAQLGDHLVNGVLNGKVLTYMSSEDYNTLYPNTMWQSVGDIKGKWDRVSDLDNLAGKKDERKEKFQKEEWQANPNHVFSKFYNEGAKNATTYFPGKKVGDVTFLTALSQQNIKDISNAIGHFDGRNRKVMTFEQFANENNLSEAFHNTFHGINPMVTIDIDLNGKKQISLYNMINEKINKSRSPITNKNILALLGKNENELTDFSASNKRIDLKNSVGDVSNLQLVLMANMLMKDHPDININEMKTIAVTNDNVNKIGVRVLAADHANINKNIQAIGKIPEFVDMLQDQSYGLKKAFTDPSYLKIESGNKYHPDQLKSFYDNDTNKYSMILPVFDNTIVNDPVRQLEYIDNRIKQLNTLPDSQEVSFERNMLMDWDKSIRNLGAKMTFTEFNKFTDIKKMQKLFSSPAGIGEEHVQYIYGLVDSAEKKVVNQFSKSLDWYFGKDGFASKYRKGGVNIIPEDIYAFNRLYHTEKVKDVSGKIDKEVFTGHFYYTDKVTPEMTETEKKLALAAKGKKLLKEELAQGERLQKFIDNQMVDAWMHNFNMRPIVTDEVTGIVHGRFYNSEDFKNQKLRDNLLAELKKDHGYSSGMLPIMEKGSSESLFTGHPQDFLEKALRVSRSMFSTFEQMEGMPFEKSEGRMTERFLWQMLASTSNPNNSLGSDGRLRRLGLVRMTDHKGDEYYQLAKHDGKDDGQGKNDKISRDLTSMLTYFTMNNVRNRIYEDELLPLVNGTKKAMEEVQKTSGINTTQIRDFITMYTKQGIEGEMNIDKEDMTIKKVAMVGTRFASILTMPFNVNVAALKTITDATRMLIESSANDITRMLLPKDMKEAVHYFGVADVAKASGLLMSGDFNKITQLAVHYNVVRSDIQDMLRDRMHTGKKFLLSDYWGHWMLNSANMMTKCMIMTAQMLKDGTYDAHTYDEKTGTITVRPDLDKRIYSSKGKFNEKGGKERLQYLLDDNRIQGSIGNEDKNPSHLYSQREARLFAYLGNKLVTGSFGDKIKPLYGSMLLGRVFGQFKTYFMQMAENALQPMQTIESGGWMKFEKDAEGKFVPQWMRPVVEGYSRTVFRRLQEFASVRSISKMEKLQPHEIYNLTKIGMMLASFLAMQQLYSHLVAEKGKKDEKDNVIPEWRIIQSWKYSYESLFIMGMAGEELRNPIPMSNIITNIFMNQYGVFSGFPNQYPGRAAVEFGKQMVTGKTPEELGHEKAKATREKKKEEAVVE